MSKSMPSPRGTNHERLFLGPRAEAAYDAAEGLEDGPGNASALTDNDGKPLVDSGTAHRVLTACIDRLNATDMGKVIDMLKEADMLSGDEVRTVTEAMKSGGGESDMASDAAIMSRRRAQTPPTFDNRFPNAKRLK